MKRSSVGACGLARLVIFCFIALTILFSLTRAKPSSAGTYARQERHQLSYAAIKKNLMKPSALTGNYTLNKYVYPGNTVFSTLSPTLTANSPPITANWPIGVPLVYVITIGNSNQNQNSLVNITLKDDLANSLGPNFVVLNISCDPFNGAVCPVMPTAGTPLPLSISGIQIKVGSSNDIVIRVLGYYTAPNTYQNIFSVFETGNQAATEEQGPAKTVQITGNWSAIDLGLTKSSSTSSTPVSTTSPATIHYKLVLTGDTTHDFYPGGLLRIQDLLSDGYPPLPVYSIAGSSFTCTTVNGSTCPAAPSPAAPGTSFSGTSSSAYTYLIWPSSTSTVIKKGDIITMAFDVSVTEGACGDPSMTIQNNASIQMDTFTYADSQNTNNSASAVPNTFTTGLQPCPPPQPSTITKTRVCPNSGCPTTLNWGDTVSYKIVVKNNSNTAQSFQVADYVSKQSITVPLRAKLMPNTSAADIHCSPATVMCTTTPATTLPPFMLDVLLDSQGLLLFTTSFTLQPNGSADDSVTLTFDVVVVQLAVKLVIGMVP